MGLVVPQLVEFSGPGIKPMAPALASGFPSTALGEVQGDF